MRDQDSIGNGEESKSALDPALALRAVSKWPQEPKPRADDGDLGRATDRDGMTGLMHAARDGFFGGIRSILSLSDAAQKDPQGRDALMHAVMIPNVEEPHENCVRVLLKASDPRAVDNEGRTALMLASRAGNAGCVALLLPVSDLGQRDPGGARCSDIAKRHGHEDLGRMLAAAEEGWDLKASLPKQGPLPNSPAGPRI